MDSQPCIDPIKILVHNVSYADLCVCIQLDHVINPTRDNEIIARPRSSRFGYVCEQLIEAINKGATFRGISFKNEINNCGSCQSSPLSTPEHYFGIEFINPPSICSWQDFHVKDRYCNYPTSSQSLTTVIRKVLFPLVGVILPKWMSMSLNEASNETRHALATPEQGRYPCLSLKKWESSGDDQDSHDTSSHDMFSNSLIDGSPTENDNDKIGNKGKGNRKYNNHNNSASEDDNYDTSKTGKHVHVNKFGNEEKQMLFINCNENETKNSPQLSEMSPLARPTVAIDNNNNNNSSNDEIATNHGVRILHDTINANNQNVQNESIFTQNSQNFQNSKNADLDDHDDKHRIDNIESSELVDIETSSDSKSRNSSSDSNKNDSSSFGSSNEEIHFDFFLDIPHAVYKVYLVSGAGHPKIKDDSTQLLSDLISHFIKEFWPKIIVKQIYSGKNIFHYGENIQFVHKVLRPVIDKERANFASHFGEKWRGYFHLAISLCGGTSARRSAIVDGLRSFEPDMLHMIHLETLWAQYPDLNEIELSDDVEYIPFDDMERYHAMKINELNDNSLIQIVNEMKKWKNEYLNKGINNKDSEIYDFWLRKSHQPVLAVLMVEKHDSNKRLKFFRGCNMEVSMPTGSVCAERNAISTAFSFDPSIKRSEFKMIAVLALPQVERHHHQSDMNNISNNISNKPNVHGRPIKLRKSSSYFKRSDEVNPRGPCGCCQEWLKKIAEANPSFKIVTFSDRTMDAIFVNAIEKK